MNEERRDPTAEQLPTLAEILEEDEEAQAELELALGYWSEADANFRPAAEARELLTELQTAAG